MRRVCGLDVHKDSIYMCILYENGPKIESVFGVLTPELDKLRDSLVSHHVCEVALESTSIYWIPIWNILSVDFSLKLVNPYFIKQLPGRKSDVKDAEWIATVLQKGLIRGSYVPDHMIQRLRQYERRNQELSKNIVHAEQRMDMILQRCNIRISNYVSCISCKGYQKVVDAIIDGESNPKMLVTLIHKRTLNKHGVQDIEDSLNGFITETDRDMLRQYRDERLQMEQHKCENKHKMQAICETHYQEELELLQTLPGIKEESAANIIAEIGVDMKMFLTASAIVGWAGLKPRNDQSAGKIKSRKITHGNKYLRKILVEAAWSAARTKDSRFMRMYQRLLARGKSKQKALIAVARKLLVLIWNMLSKKEAFDPEYNRRIQAA